MTRPSLRFSPVSPLLLGALLFVSGTALAQPSGGPDGRRGPPPEAIEACADLDAQDVCEVETREGTKAGSCLRPPDADDVPLACVPDDAPRPGKRPARE